jgi:hypothetical protein
VSTHCSAFCVSAFRVTTFDCFASLIRTILVGGLSEEGNKLITKSRQKYLTAFSQLIRQGLPEETTASQVLQRISKLMMLLPIAEVSSFG